MPYKFGKIFLNQYGSRANSINVNHINLFLFSAVILGSVLVILILGTATYVCRYVPKVTTNVCNFLT